MSLGKRLSTLRKQANMTQSELGDKLNISAQAVSKWERNTSEPDITTLRKLAGIYGISVSEIIEPQKNSAEAASPATEVTSDGETSTNCDVYLTEVSHDKKVSTLNYLMNMLGIGLAEAMKIWDSRPYLISGNETQEMAEQISAYMSEVGATVVSKPASGMNVRRELKSLKTPEAPKETHDMRRRFIVANLTAGIPGLLLMILLFSISANFGDVLLSLWVGGGLYTFIFSMWYPTLTRKLMTPVRSLSFEGFFGGIGSSILFLLFLPWTVLVALISPIDYALSLKKRIERMKDEDDDDDIFWVEA